MITISLAAYFLSPRSICKGVKCTLIMMTMLHDIVIDAPEMPECAAHLQVPAILQTAMPFGILPQEAPCVLTGIHMLQAFLSETLDGDRFEIKETLMPDSMHPSAVGMRIIATRLEPLVSQLVASAKDMPQRSR